MDSLLISPRDNCGLLVCFGAAAVYLARLRKLLVKTSVYSGQITEVHRWGFIVMILGFLSTGVPWGIGEEGNSEKNCARL